MTSRTNRQDLRSQHQWRYPYHCAGTRSVFQQWWRAVWPHCWRWAHQLSTETCLRCSCGCLLRWERCGRVELVLYDARKCLNLSTVTSGYNYLQYYCIRMLLRKVDWLFHVVLGWLCYDWDDCFMLYWHDCVMLYWDDCVILYWDDCVMLYWDGCVMLYWDGCVILYILYS